MSGEFKNKVVVITGGSKGIGLATAKAFAVEGAKVVLAASGKEGLEKAAAEIVKAGGAAPTIVAADLRTLEGCKSVFEAVEKAHGRCDVLINNAGAARGGNFLELGDDVWQDGFALKFFGAVRLSRLLWPMLRAAQGHLISIVGTAARAPEAGFLTGGSINAALAHFTKGLAALGRSEGVNVNVIHPGVTETARVTANFEQRAKANNITLDQVRKNVAASERVLRLGAPEDSANLALFLCSEKARHIQGVAIAVDGGATTGLF